MIKPTPNPPETDPTSPYETDFGQGQGFTGVGQQFFAVDAGGGEVAGVGFELIPDTAPA
jgi:hypothetical protein